MVELVYCRKAPDALGLRLGTHGVSTHGIIIIIIIMIIIIMISIVIIIIILVVIDCYYHRV